MIKNSLIICSFVIFSVFAAVATADWPMPGHDLERTSWTSDVVTGALQVEWWKKIDPYISQKVQVIAANGNLYIATARGLYAIDAATGDDVWTYPTEMPLGHSPTVDNGVVYIGCFDKRVHAINATTGERIWVSGFAGAGFNTNPIVVEGKVIAGNRDGSMYAYDKATGQLAWSYTTGGPVLFSPAYKDGSVYFASNDSRAYAVNASDGALVWQSAKLPGAGFHSWWPVLYEDRVVLMGSENIRDNGGNIGPNGEGRGIECWKWGDNLYNCYVGEVGTVAGPWPAGTTTLDLSEPYTNANGSTFPVTEFLETDPWHRMVIILRQSDGSEVTYDFDNDGNPEYAPLLLMGTHSGNRHPPVIAPDGSFHIICSYWRGSHDSPWGDVVTWDMDTPIIGLRRQGYTGWASDEPHAIAGGGDLVTNRLYNNRCCWRGGGSNGLFDSVDNWYWGYNLETMLPGIDDDYSLPNSSVRRSFGSPNGIYGGHGDNNPPIPYNGRVYTHRYNHLIAWSTTGTKTLKPAATVQTPSETLAVPTKTELTDLLKAEVRKMINAGHLRPGWHCSGMSGLIHYNLGDHLFDHFSIPGETIITLCRAVPHMGADPYPDDPAKTWEEKLKEYIQSEFTAFPPYTYNHIGWDSGAKRQIFDLPPSAETDMAKFAPMTFHPTWPPHTDCWDFPPQCNYALYKYAEVFNNATEMLSNLRTIDPSPDDTYLTRYPHINNAYIAGYIGSKKLYELAGQTVPQAITDELNRLQSLRSSTFTKDGPPDAELAFYESCINVCRNFMDMTPELAEYLRTTILTDIQTAVDEYEFIAPHWFVTRNEEGHGETVLHHLLDTPAIFTAKAWILQDPYEELAKYIDVPAFEKGDLYYIDNLVSAIEAAHRAPDYDPPTPDPLTWASVPASAGATSISMTATTGTDQSRVEYYFECTAGGGNDSGWQDGTTYEDTGLSPSTQYTYRVQARDKSANRNAGGWSSTESATTYPAAPSDLAVVAISSNAIDLSWTDNSNNEDGFIVERTLGANPSEVIIDEYDPEATVTGNWTLSTDNIAGWDVDYLYIPHTDQGQNTVKYAPAFSGIHDYDIFIWYNSIGDASWRATNARVTIVHATGTDVLSIDMSTGGEMWELLGTFSMEAESFVEISNAGANNYVIADAFKFTPAPAQWAQIADLPADTIAYADAGLEPNTAYSYRVKAFNAQGSSAFSNIASAVTVPTLPSPADLDGNGVIDNADLDILADQWLQAPGVPSADIAPPPNGDNIVDLLDFAVIANEWLSE